MINLATQEGIGTMYHPAKLKIITINGTGLNASLDVWKGGRFEVTFMDSDQT